MVVTAALGIPLIQSLVGASTGLTVSTALTPRERFPGITPGDIARISIELTALNERGLEGRLTLDPFTGGFVISSADQAGVLEQILLERAVREALSPTPLELQDIRDIQTGAVQRGTVAFASRAAALIPAATGSVVARVVAPGVVARGPIPAVGARKKSELAGPCSGPQTGIQRLRCQERGFA